ncbi:GNAT family N-acetyltransferase [Nocardioides sp. Bht2]|uniref:GNAT family N-acetyltransferase n=1 Tax=Nocardioides sp. Bht2 TaxID=3392297 RepID=UPI0039B647A7
MSAQQPVEAWEIRRVPFTDVAAQQLIADVQAEYTERYGSPDESPVDPGDFELPAGSFYVGRLDGVPVATGAWRRSSVSALGAGNSVEIKRMYVAPAARRRGLSRLMLAHLEESAGAAGAEVMVLETGIRQPEAIALYLASGYTEVPGFGHYSDSPLSRCFAKLLSRT